MFGNQVLRVVSLVMFAIAMAHSLCGCPPAAEGEGEADPVVHFSDLYLERVVRNLIQKPEGDLLVTDVFPITVLDASRREPPIYGLDGLEYCTNLRELYLQDNRISDISPLQGLRLLEILELEKNQICDVSVLDGMPKLQTLRLDENRITEINLQDLTELTTLCIKDNEIAEIQMKNVPSLRLLSIDNNPLVSVLIEKADALVRLALPGSQSLLLLRDMSGLEQLRFFLAEGADVDLTNLPSLATLSAGGDLNNIGWLGDLNSLESLNLHNGQVGDIDVLAGLVSLTNLYLSDNQIADISALAGLPSLIDLYLRNNQIADISALAGLPSLTDLYLGDNQIADISALAGLRSLTHLSLSDNQIADISALAGLPNLESLNLNSNNVVSLNSLIANPGLGDGDSVQVRENPLRQEALCNQIPILQGRGVGIQYSGSCESH